MVRKLLKSDYTKQELKDNPDAPFWDSEDDEETKEVGDATYIE